MQIDRRRALVAAGAALAGAARSAAARTWAAVAK